MKPPCMDLSKMTKAEKDEMIVTNAAIMLHDDGLEISAEKLSKIIKESGNEVEPYWPMLFAKALKGQDIDAMLTKASDSNIIE